MTGWLVTVALAAVTLFGGGFLAYQFWWLPAHPALVPSTPMPDQGDDPTTDMRSKTAAFYAANPECNVASAASLGVTAIIWQMVQGVVNGLGFTVGDQTPGGPITADRTGDCKQWAGSAYKALVAAGVPARALRFVWCEYQGGGHIMLALVGSDGAVWLSEVQSPAFAPWTDKSDHTSIRIERADKSAPWQVVS